MANVMKRQFLLLTVVAATLANAATPPTIPAELDLATAIGLTLENNFSIRQARERIRQQEGVVTSVRAASLPTVSAAGTVQESQVAAIQTTPAPTFIPQGRFWRLSLTASQILYSGGGVGASIRSAELNREAAVLDLQSVVNAALLNTRTRFFDVLLARAQAKVQEENLRLLEAAQRDTSKRVEAGTVSAFEGLRAEVAVANARAPLIAAQNDYRLAIENLRLVLGVGYARTTSAEAGPLIVGDLVVIPNEIQLQQALDSAKAKRPDLLRQAKIVAALEQGVTVARADYFPRVIANAGGEFRKGSTDKLADSMSGARGSLQVQGNVFDRATTGRVAQTASQLEQARLSSAESMLAAELEIRRAFSEIEQASELSSAMRQTVAQAEEAVRLARARYEVGSAVQLDLLKSQVELTTARSSALRADHGYAVAAARLHAAMGITDVVFDLGGVVREAEKR